MKSGPQTSRSVSSDKPLGAKEDNSVLFSLDSLKAQSEEASAPKPKPAGAAKADNSGLIDLSALEALAQAGESAQAPIHAHVPIFPFGAPETLQTAPPTTVAPAAEQAEPVELKRSNKKAGVIASLVVGAAAIAGVAFMSTHQDAPLMTLSPELSHAFGDAGKRIVAAQPPPAAEPQKKVEPAPAEKEPANAIGKRPGPLANPSKPGIDPKKPPPPTPPVENKPKPPPPSENCDLMCQMARAAGKK